MCLYSFINCGPRRGWVVSATPQPLYSREKEQVPNVQEAVWVPGPVRTSADNFTPTGIRSPDCPDRSQSLYQLRYPSGETTTYLAHRRTSSGNSSIRKKRRSICWAINVNERKLVNIIFFLLALQPPLGVVFYSPLVGFSLLACEVS